MQLKSARDIWDEKAEERVKRMRDNKMAASRKLYEETCWRYLEPLLPAKQARVLEAGCGTGRWVYRLAPLGHRVVLSDFSPEMVRVAQEQAEENGIADSVESCQVLDICDMNTLDDNSFDIVLALGEPLGLCPDARKAVSELHRVAKPGGYVLCDVANRFRRALDYALSNEWQKASTVLESGKSLTTGDLPHTSFSVEGLRGLMENEALQVVHIAAVCPLMTFPPRKDQMTALENNDNFNLARDIFSRFAEDREMMGVSSRLLAVGRKKG